MALDWETMDTNYSRSYQRLIDAVGEQRQYYGFVADNSRGLVFSQSGPLSTSGRQSQPSGHPPSCIDGKVTDPKKLQQTCLRMCVINAIVMWESFFWDIVEEAFTLAYKKGSFDATKREKILTQAIAKYFDFKDIQETQPESKEARKIYDELESLDKDEVKFSQKLFEAHLSNRKATKYTPVLRQLEEFIKDTFDEKECTLIAPGSKLTFKYLYHRRKEGDTADSPKISSQAANDLIRLFYALRCCYSHGHVEIKTLEMFPDSVDKAKDQWETEDDRFVTDFLKLYERIKRYETDKNENLYIGYRTACNILYFVKALAYKVMEYLRNYLKRNCRLNVWRGALPTEI